ncbi:MAG: heparinase II/III domain-containing protein [Sphingobium sp.]
MRKRKLLTTLRDPMAISISLAGFIGAYYEASPEAIKDAASGRFTLLGETVDFGAIENIDWYFRLPAENDHHLWRMKLSQCEVLHSLTASGDPAHQSTILGLLDSFERAAAIGHRDAFKNIWSPYGASHRMLAMLSGLALARPGALSSEVTARLRAFIRRDAAFVLANVEHDLCNNHTERNLAALCLYGVASGGLAPHLCAKLDLAVTAIIRATVLPDGMQVERSAMYQGLTVMSLRIFSEAFFLRPSTRKLAAQKAIAAGRAWAFMTHEDGEITLFNDSWTEEVPPVSHILGSSIMAEPLPDILADAGYARLRAERFSLWMDAGAIGPSWNPGHGHADFLSIELDVDGKRLIVDPGTAQYSTGQRRSFERSAASHNGPRFIYNEPVEYLGCFKVGRMTSARLIPPAELEVLEFPAIGGFIPMREGTVCRIAAHLPGGLLIADHWTDATPGAVRLLIPADWNVLDAGTSTIQLVLDDRQITIRALRGRLTAVSAGQWCRRYMRPEGAHVVALEPERTGDVQNAMLLIGDSACLPCPQEVEKVAGLCASQAALGR